MLFQELAVGVDFGNRSEAERVILTSKFGATRDSERGGASRAHRGCSTTYILGGLYCLLSVHKLCFVK